MARLRFYDEKKIKDGRRDVVDEKSDRIKTEWEGDYLYIGEKYRSGAQEWVK